MTGRRVLLAGLCCLASLPMTKAPAQEAHSDADALFEDYMTADALVKAGRLADAVFPFYRGQFRSRLYLTAHPDMPADGAPAAFGSFNLVLGDPINRYAFGDLPALLATLDRVLAWHAAEDDPVTPKASFPDAHAQVTAGLVRLRDYVATHGDTIRAQRRANGLPNRH